MMKLEDVLKAGGSYEIRLSDGTSLLLLGTPKALIALEKADDAGQLLHMTTVVATGRRKGEKSKMLVPYDAITQIYVA